MSEVQSPEAMLEAVFAKQLGEEKPARPQRDDPPEDEPEAEDAEEEVAEELASDEPTEKPADETPEDGEDVELEGETFKLPKKVKDAVLRNKDYTQKTQELASQRKIVEDKQQYVEAREQFIQHAFKEAAEVEAIKTQLAQFDSVDWNSLIQSDPQQAMRLNFAKQQLSQGLQTAETKLADVAGRIRAAETQHKAKQTELGRAELARRLGQITEQDRTSMLSLAQELAFDERDLMSPAAINALALAAKYKALQTAKPNIEKRVQNVKPVTPPSARTSNQTLEASKTKALQDRYRKTGKTADVESFLQARI
jgi:ubiquitin